MNYIQKLVIVIFSVVFTSSLFSQDYSGPVSKITTGYGAPGSYTPKTEFFEVLPDWDKYYTDEKTTAFITYPQEHSGPVPVIFWIPWDSDSKISESTMYNINKARAERFASQGYCFLTLQYNSPGDLNESNKFGLCKALLDQVATDYTNIIDTTRIGIFGTFSGGPRAIQVAAEKFIYGNWGQNGRFLMVDQTTPAIVGGDWEESGKPVFTDQVLDDMPDDMKYISVMGDLTHWYDPSFAIDFHYHMGVPDSNKAFFEIESDTQGSYIYYASSVTSITQTFMVNDTWSKYVFYDAYDEYVYFRTIDALGKLLWDGDYNARRYCLGKDEFNHIPVADGQLKPITNTLTPDPDRYWYAKARGGFYFPCWSLSWNLRKYYTSNPCFGTSATELIMDEPFAFYPNPLNNSQQLSFSPNWINLISNIEIYSASGQLIQKYGPEQIESNSIKLKNPLGNYSLLYVKVTFKNNQGPYTQLIAN